MPATTSTARLLAFSLLTAACGDDTNTSATAASTTSGLTSTSDSSDSSAAEGTDTAASSSSSSSSSTSSASSSSATDPSTAAETQASTDASATAGTDSGATDTSIDTNTDTSDTSDTSDSDSDSGSTDSGGLPPCDPLAIPDTLEFVFSKAIEIGVDTLQAGYYDNTRKEVTVLSFFGDGKRLDVDGNVLGDVQAPPEALPKLDAAAYDTVADVGLLLNQACILVEVDPETMGALKVTPLGFGMSICAGLAIDAERNLYIASYGTKELVVLDRDATEVILRESIVGMPNLDGIAEIAGSDNFLVNDTVTLTAAIIDPAGKVLVPSGKVGAAPPLTGGGPVPQPDSMLTICLNGHTWVCDAYGTKCSDFAPKGGDKEACGCLIPQ